jgi:DNA repair protein RadC
MNQINTEKAGSYLTASQTLSGVEANRRKHFTSTDDEIVCRAMNILKARMHGRTIYDNPMTSPDTVKGFLKLKIGMLEHEEFHVLFLNNQHELIEHQSMFKGTIDGASVYPREVVKEALKLNAAAVILAHNHPSGISEPSQSDRQITNKLKSALDTVDIRVLDHFIIGKEIYSFAENGLI